VSDVRVELGDRSYDIVIGAGTLDEAPALLTRHQVGRRIFLASDPCVYELYGSDLEERLCRDGREVVHLLIPEGEKHKTLETVENLYTYLVAQRADRHSTLVAVGGGVTGDVGGFVAATYQRGMPFVQVPTTLLAQVDSSVGGKTGVNHKLAKNLIGAFHQPALVIVDTQTLASLPERQYQSGLYEVAKYGLIYDADFFRFFVDNLQAIIQRDPAVLEPMISRCCEIKAAVISIDEREQGLRQILNFGHTLGHALEAAVEYAGVTHGEAIAYGMLASLRLSRAMGLLDEATVDEVSAALLDIGSLPAAAGIPFGRLSDAMEHDKKRRDGHSHFVLLTEIGATLIQDDVDLALVAEAWQSAVVQAETATR